MQLGLLEQECKETVHIYLLTLVCKVGVCVGVCERDRWRGATPPRHLLAHCSVMPESTLGGSLGLALLCYLRALSEVWRSPPHSQRHSKGANEREKERFFKHGGLKACNVLHGVVAKILLFLGLYDIEGRNVTMPQSPLQFLVSEIVKRSTNEGE